MNTTVDASIFDDPYIEACTRCVEEKMKISNEESSDFLLNPIMMASPVQKKYGGEKILNSYKILVNAGMPKRAELLRDIFYSSTQVDLAKEPISSSKL
jgi:hypothetical protein